MRLSDLNPIPWYLKPFFWRQKRKYGQELNPATVWASSPRLFLTVASLYGAIDRKRSPISPVLRSLLTVKISQINDCAFCVDVNSATLLKRAVSEEKQQSLKSWRDADCFSDEERAALAYAEKVTLSGEQVDDVCFSELKKYFDDKAIVELTALIAFQNLSSKFNNALDIEPQGFCELKPKVDIE